MMRTRVLLVDDHQIMRDGLRLFLRDQPGIELVGEASDAASAGRLAEELLPDVVVTDINLINSSGIELSRTLHERNPHAKVVILSAHFQPELVNAAILAGARGYVIKTRAARELLDSITTVMAGQVYLCPEAVTAMTHDYRLVLQAGRDSRASLLTERERDVLVRVADGQNTKEIAGALEVSVKTIETHRKHLMAKLRLNSIADLTKFAIREGLTSL
jgi:DNA-binding NarL/FixJ family response regulator